METVAMGRVIVPAKIENLGDILDCKRGRLGQDQIRFVEIPDALVDTGATFLSMPRRLIEQLGLHESRTRKTRTAAGLRESRVYEPVRLTVQGRECFPEVADSPDECPVLIGQLPLEVLDFVVDSAGQKLIGNPEHGGEQMIDMF
jgi:predicted aspartyl protease